MRGHTGSVRAVAWESLKWNYIASAGNDYTVRLWNVARGSQVDLFKGHTDVIRALAFSPDGLILASSAEDTTIRLYHVGQLTGSTTKRPAWLPLLPGSGVELRVSLGPQLRRWKKDIVSSVRKNHDNATGRGSDTCSTLAPTQTLCRPADRLATQL